MLSSTGCPVLGYRCPTDRIGRAAVVVTHDLNLASQFATRIVLMDAGTIVANGSVHEVLRPEVLIPVYGPNLAFGALPAEGWGEDRPFVLPWCGPEEPPSTQTVS